MSLRETYDKIAEDWHKDHRRDSWWEGTSNHFVSLVKPGGLILDVGCGGGLQSRRLLDRGFRVLGIDFSPKMIEIARRENSEAEFHVMDMRNVRDLHGTFDGIIAQAALLHIPKAEAEAAIRGFASKLNPGGYLYVSVKQPRPGNPEEEIVQENDYGYPYERFFSYYHPEELRAHFLDAGLKIVYDVVTPANSTRWIEMIGEKVQ